MSAEKKVRVAYRLVSLFLAVVATGFYFKAQGLTGSFYIPLAIASLFFLALSFAKYREPAFSVNVNSSGSSSIQNSSMFDMETRANSNPLDYSNPIAASRMDTNGLH